MFVCNRPYCIMVQELAFRILIVSGSKESASGLFLLVYVFRDSLECFK